MSSIKRILQDIDTYTMGKPGMRTHTTRAGAEFQLLFPHGFSVCHRCEGRGTHVNPNVDGNGISPEEFAADPEFEENYFSGVYDVRCYECNGERVVPTVKRARLTKFQRVLFDAICENEARERAEIASEREYGY